MNFQKGVSPLTRTWMSSVLQKFAQKLSSNPPDVLQHVQHLRGEMGVLHIKLSQVGFQQAGGRLFGLQGGGLLPDSHDPEERHRMEAGHRRGEVHQLFRREPSTITLSVLANPEQLLHLSYSQNCSRSMRFYFIFTS